MRCSVLRSLPMILCVLTTSSARAEDQSPVPVCPAGNLLAHKRPSSWQDVSRDLGLLTDEQMTPEGAMWDSAPAVIFETAASTVTWDLGAVTAIRSFAIQADANDTYTVWGSLDGKSFKVYGQIDPVENH